MARWGRHYFDQQRYSLWRHWFHLQSRKFRPSYSCHFNHFQAKFSQNYTVTELEKRWFDLMYDDQINARAKFRLSRCSPDLIDRMEVGCLLGISWRAFTFQSRVPLSLSEKFVLEDRSLVQLADAQKLMMENPAAFQYARTPQQLIDQSHILNMWVSLRRLYCHKLCIVLLGSKISNFKWSNIVLRAKSRRKSARFVPFDVRLARPSSHTSEESDTDEIRPIRVMPELPYLKGKNAVFPILHDRVLIGRSTSTWKADVNLSEEGPASIIARKQAILSCDAQNEYKIKNTGRRPMIVDAKVLLEGDYTIIHHYSVIEIAYIRLVFICL